MIPWRREQLPTPVFWPREFHGLNNPWSRKEQDTTEQLSLSISFRNIKAVLAHRLYKNRRKAFIFQPLMSSEPFHNGVFPALACEAQMCFTAGRELPKPWSGTAASQFLLLLPSDLKHDIPVRKPCLWVQKRVYSACWNAIKACKRQAGRPRTFQETFGSDREPDYKEFF